jgi:predicted AlkP superfamily pyrophosphatase or phosphodiesterase
MAGHLADGVYWYDENTGGWITSRYYRKDGTLPAWVSAINAAKVPHSYLGKKWELSVPTDALARLWKPNGGDASKYVDDRNGIGTAFPHTLGAGQTTPGKDLFRAFTNTPFANAWVLDTAERCVREEKLGQDDIPDILAINLSSNDYIGHSFGPDSAEVLDVTVQTDRQLSDFLNRLAKDVPGGLNSVTIVLTADHGAPPVPLLLQDSGIRGGIWKGKDVEKAAKDALVKELGEGDWVIEYQEPYLWLNHDALKQKNIDRARAERIASEAITQLDGIYAAYPRSKVLSGEIARTRITDHVTLGFHPLVSGDIALVSLPFFMPRGSLKGETHAEPYTYDDRVPLIIAGAGIRPGTYTERVSTLDIAPTLSFLAHVQQPSGCEGRILSRALLADGAKK